MAQVAMPGMMGSGSAMVDANGMTLYTYDKDAVGKSTCYGDCATVWVPLTVGANTTESAGWTIVTRDDGSKMWAYMGHPVYTYTSDKTAGDMTGDAKDGFHVASGKDDNSTTSGSASAGTTANVAAAVVNTEAADTTKSGQDANSTTNGSTSDGTTANDAAAAKNTAAAATTDSGKDTNSTTEAAASGSADSDMVSIATMATTSAGPAWVDSKGMALYTFDKDANGKSMCDGECAVQWPPLSAAADAVGNGEWTIVTRSDASRMWAYKGHPLYTFVGDKAAGEVTGNGVDGFHLAM